MRRQTPDLCHQLRTAWSSWRHPEHSDAFGDASSLYLALPRRFCRVSLVVATSSYEEPDCQRVMYATTKTTMRHSTPNIYIVPILISFFLSFFCCLAPLETHSTQLSVSLLPRSPALYIWVGLVLPGGIVDLLFPNLLVRHGY